MSYLTTELISHARRVRKLYKDAARMTQSYYHDRHLFRYHAVLLRARFDEHKEEVDMVKIKKILQEGERELFLKQHPQPQKFANSAGGVAFGREQHSPDWLLDTWHPLEKAQYPEYFAKREIRKKEFIERWEKKYGSPEQDLH
ncbi:hypothetical protein ScPMuIL_001944 [Solemya velum]